MKYEIGQVRAMIFRIDSPSYDAGVEGYWDREKIRIEESIGPIRLEEAGDEVEDGWLMTRRRIVERG